VSAIFGLIHLDDSPLRAEELSAMRSAIGEWGSDGGGTWSEGAAGLGNLIRFDTPEASHEVPPSPSAQSFVLAAEARLDNREELCGELGIPHLERPSVADGSLIQRAYERWAEKTPEHLVGDWSFAVWHPREKRLFLARDHFGNTGLYYYKDERRFAFASSRKAVFALGVPRRLNEFYLACVLVSWTAHHGPQTIDPDVHRLPPAHTLTLADGRLHVDQYWRLEDVPELHLKDSGEYIEGLLSVYDRAVRDRLRSSKGIGIAMSGGLDSGSTALLAARGLRERNERLRAYIAVPTHEVAHASTEHTVGNEWHMAQSTAAAAGNVDLIAVAATGTTPIAGIKSTLAIHDEPGHAASNAFWIQQLLGSAHRDGLGTLLTGQGGNATVSWTGVDRPALIQSLRRAHSWKIAAEILAYPYLPLPLIRGLRYVLHRRGLDWSRTAINTDFAVRIGLSGERIRRTGDVTQVEAWYSPRLQRYGIIRPGASPLGAIWAENGAAHRLDVRDATYDKRVMEFAISIPDREYTGPDGMDRWIIRAAMRGLMPDEVRLNRRLGMQAADVGHRLLDSAAEVERTLDEIEASELARMYLNLPRLRHVWESLKKEVGPETTHSTITILTRGIMTGLYLVGREKSS
jgi:asparagine synthase (glutamine-hydrolysing)